MNTPKYLNEVQRFDRLAILIDRKWSIIQYLHNCEALAESTHDSQTYRYARLRSLKARRVLKVVESRLWISRNVKTIRVEC